MTLLLAPPQTSSASFSPIKIMDSKGGSIGHVEAGHPRAFAVASIRRRVSHLWQNGASSHTPLAAVYHKNKWSSIRITNITKALINSVEISGSQVGFKPEYVSAWSMRAGGAMVLLISRFNTDTIRLVGRWRSNIMLRYLHTSAQIFTSGLAARMVQHGYYVLIPPAHGG